MHMKKRRRGEKSRIGIWTFEDYVTERGFDSKTYVEKKPETKPVSVSGGIL